MTPAKLELLLGFSLFYFLSPPVLSGIERLSRYLCKEYNDPCFLDADPGSCYEIHFRFFYNKTAKACQSFLFTGCDGNLNNFKLKIDCDVACQEAYKNPPPRKPEPEPGLKSMCVRGGSRMSHLK